METVPFHNEVPIPEASSFERVFKVEPRSQQSILSGLRLS
jgi:hypothetical protein